MRLMAASGLLLFLLSLLILSPYPQSVEDLWYGPYVQRVGADRASIVWITSDRSPGVVLARPAAGAGWFEATSAVRELPPALTGLSRTIYQHRADLTALAPGVEYVYRVFSANSVPDGEDEQQFKTAGDEPFTFLAFGDAGVGSLGQAQVAARMNEERAALVLITGDVVYHGSTFAAYQRYYFPYYSYLMKRVPFFPSLGNHDYEADKGAPYLAVHVLPTDGVPEEGRGRFYSFDWGNVHFVCLDSVLSLEDAIGGRGPMIEWLEKDLAGSRQFWKVVYLHHPPFPTNNYTWDPACARIRERIVPILERHHVDLVLAGHEHNYQRTIPRRNGAFFEKGPGVTYVITGGGGAPLYETREDPILAARKSAYHYVRVEVTGARLRLTAIDADGETIDSTEMAPPPEIYPEGVVDSLTYQTELRSGEYVSIFGHHFAAEEFESQGSALPPRLRNVTVSLNGAPLPLLYVSPSQINARLPLSVSGEVTLQVRSDNGFATAQATIR